MKNKRKGNMTKKLFKIPVEWAEYGTLEIEAHTVEEAIKIAEEDDSIPLPDGNYIESSWQVNQDKALIEAMNKNPREVIE